MSTEEDVRDFFSKNPPLYFYNENILDMVPLGSGQNCIYITSQRGSHDYRKLLKNNIKSVLCINTKKKPQKILKRYEENSIDQLHFDLEDSEVADISSIFEETFQYITTKLMDSNVLVHCAAGMSRSVTIILYYLVKSGFSSNLVEALTYMKKCRPCMDPNPGFLKQLFMAANNFSKS